MNVKFLSPVPAKIMAVFKVSIFYINTNIKTIHDAETVISTEYRTVLLWFCIL
jgi:hypothetical protein